MNISTCVIVINSKLSVGTGMLFGASQNILEILLTGSFFSCVLETGNDWKLFSEEVLNISNTLLLVGFSPF